ncbi:hypothetical protein [Streptomyces profundus]|uniref:hypothetical protein n=1 Tax=Streptomyces profundus TaxID=2867410 RepID=UPI001D169D66|nr:hypothetical protein [Streptomyces sp. MA3_2.13]UED83282.1 hypothetical protein K4G22_02935 [Streptomyces sp. MA3_2.13]
MRRTINRLSVAVATGVLLVTAAGVASADVEARGSRTWQRPCGTTYDAKSSGTLAQTTKRTDGSCDGHAWVRVKYKAGNWSSWQHANGTTRIENSAGNIVRAEHKGCETCTVYTTTP